MGFAEDALKVLGRCQPRADAPPAPEAARKEALSLTKRADGLYAKDPRGPGATQALSVWVEALDLDPSCKGAYEGLAKTVLARGEGDRPSAEAAVRVLGAGLERLPDEPSLKDLEKKLRAFLPARPLEPALQAKTARASERRPMAPAPGQGAGRVCKFCSSPIPIGAPECRSCSMSGELPRPDGVVDRRVSPSGGISPVVIAIIVVILVAGGAVGAWLGLGRAHAVHKAP